MQWSIQKIWNESIIQKQSPAKVRNYIWAGDIGKNHYERYLKMNAIVPDKPYDDRTLRKFSAGIWFEDQIGYILKTIGILKSSQEWVNIPEDAEHLRVMGRLDFIAGGLTDWNEARERVRNANFPEFIETISYELINYFEKEYPGGLEEAIIEVKSVNSQVFWSKKDYLSEAYPHHQMQLYTYLKALNKPLGKILYISKDDLTIQEMVVVYPDVNLENKWQEDVRAMTNYWREKKEPPKPESIVFDTRKKISFRYDKKPYSIQGAWIENWEVKWSPYFQRITECKNEEQWLDKIRPIISEKNHKLKDEFLSKLIN